jgi:hypothetical protein
VLDNQYYLVFGAVPKNKAGLQRVRISTESPGFEIAAADNVWVPAPNEASGGKKDELVAGAIRVALIH